MSSQDRVEIFTREFLAYRPILARTVVRILHCGPQEVEDVLQDVWIKGATYVAKHPVEHHKSWLYQIAFRTALSRLRDAKRRPNAVSRDGEASTIDRPDHGPRPDEIAAWRELREAVSALERRIPKQIAALRLVHLEEHTYLETAELLGIAEGTAKSNVFKALRQLRAALLPEQDAA